MKLSKLTGIEKIFLFWFITACLLGPNLLGKIYLSPLTQLLFILILLILIILILNKTTQVKPLKMDAYVGLIAIGLFLYIIGIFLGAILTPFAESSYYRVLNKSLLVAAWIVAMFLSSRKSINLCMQFYANFMFILATLANFLYFLVLFTPIQPISWFTYINQRTYANYIIGLTENLAASLLHMGIPILRAISFYEEPGTFGLMLLPAIFWLAIVEKNNLKLALVGLASLLTFSVGSWLNLILIVTLMVTINFNKTTKKRLLSKKRLIFSFMSLFSIIAVINIGLSALSIDPILLIEYVTDKFNLQQGEESSGGYRFNLLSNFIHLILNYPTGVSLETLQKVFGTDFGSFGYLGTMVEVGLVGIIGYLLVIAALLGIIIRSFKQRKYKDDMTLALSASVLSMLMMGLQRFDLLNVYVSVFMAAFLARNHADSATRVKLTTISMKLR